MFEAPAKVFRNWIAVQAFIRRNGGEILGFEASKTYRLQDGQSVQVVRNWNSNTWQGISESFTIVKAGA
jgi:hypothetical protein